jgi:hypothetical protein
MAKQQQAQFEDMVEDGGDVPSPNEVDNPTAAVGFVRKEAEFAAEDLAPNYLKLAQGLTKEVQDGEARPGQWLIKGYDPEAEVLVVPLAFYKTRELRSQEERQVLCGSADSIVGTGTPGGVCESCPLSKWTDNPDGSRQGPKCRFQYQYAVFSVTHGDIAFLTFAGKALKAAKSFNSVVSRLGLGNAAILLKSEQSKGKMGNVTYVPTVSPVPVDAGVLAAAKQRFATGA